RAMEAKHRRDKIDERRLVGNLRVVEESCPFDVARTSVRLDATPVVRALKRERRVLRNFQLDHGEATVAAQSQKVNRPRGLSALARRTELRVQRREPKA